MSSQPPSVTKPKPPIRFRLILAGVILLIYFVASCCPAFRFDKYYPGNADPQSSEIWFGWTALVLGWLGLLLGCVAWLANILLGLGLLFLLLGWRWANLICSGLTVLVSLDLFRVFWFHIPADEGGVGQAVLRPPMAGVWLWFASIATAFVAAWILFLAPRTQPHMNLSPPSLPRDSLPKARE